MTLATTRARAAGGYSSGSVSSRPTRVRFADLARCCLALPLLVAALGARATVTPVESDAERLKRTLLRSEAQALENGEGVERDPTRAAQLYCDAARLGDAEAQFNLGWMYANGRGVERSDATAAYFFHAAAEQGLEQAVRMLDRVGGPPNYTPDCMREGEPARTAATAPRAAAAAPPAPTIAAPPDILALVKRLAPQYGLAPQLVLAFIQAESNFDVVALSPRNAKGLMQLIPDTAARFNVRKPYDPEQNVRGGMAYLRWLLSYYRGDVLLAAAAYNAGEGTVNRYRGVPPYAETRAYVRRILANFGQALHPFDRTLTEAAPLPQLAR